MSIRAVRAVSAVRHAAVWLIMIGAAVLAPAAESSNASWPRTYSKAGTTVVLYQPQVDAWKDYETIRFRSAVAVTAQPGAQTEYGVVAAQATTDVDFESRKVYMTNINIAVRFPGMQDDLAAPLKALVKDLLPSMNSLDISLDQVTAHMHAPPNLPKVDVNLAPPPIYYSDAPAILVNYIGEPQFKPVTDTQLMFAVNTNWTILMDMDSAQYYLLDGTSWLTAADPMKGPWTPAAKLPDSLSKLPDNDQWKDVRKAIPGTPFSSTPPTVYTSDKPAEIIVTNGPPEYTPIPGTRLMYVSNPQTPLFWDLIDMNYYLLAAGRWFRSKQVSGPWTAASADLPLEFARIPADSPMGFVLTSIPNTQEAQDAILLASIPHKATIKTKDAKLDVTYDGEPKFEPIKATDMTYAVNTSYQVVCADQKYYCCYNGVWFVSDSATGPWAVCTSVPKVIYTIPSSSPLYNTTYVYVYDSTPDTVVVGYTGGYYGEYVGPTGALVYGAGYWYPSPYWYAYPACYYSYGCWPYYNYAYGGYYRGGGYYYGPYGGAGWHAGYNPATGTWSRSGYAYGPGGEVHGGQAYNPYTNTYGQHTGGSDGYKSWGNSYVQRGNQWAEASHQTNSRGSVGQASDSSGQWVEGAHSSGTDSSIAKTSSGNVYASHDGNVYKKSDGQWQKYTGNGNWQDTSWNRPNSNTASSWQSSMEARTQQNSSFDNWRSDFSNNNQWQNSWENRSNATSNNWAQHDTYSGLNSDAWSRDRGNYNAGQYQNRDNFGGEQRNWGGGGGWGGGERSWGGGGWGGGGGGRFRR